MSNKKDELNLKGPDAFQVKAATTAEYLKANWKLVAGLSGLLFVSAVSYVIVQKVSSSARLERQVALSKVDQLYQNEGKSFSETKAQLEKELDELKLSNKDKPSKELSEKINSLESKLKKSEKPNHAGSMNDYKKLFDEHPKTPQGLLAGIYYAHLLVEDKKNEEAVKVLSKVVPESSKYKVLALQAGAIYATLLEDAGRFDEALESVNKLLPLAGEGLKPHFLLAKGRIQLLKKDKSGAEKTFDEIAEKYSSSLEADKALGLRALLN